MKSKAALEYFDLLQSQAEETSAEEALIISETLVRETESALKQGKGVKGDVLRAKTLVASGRLSLAKAKEALRISSVKLAATLRLEPQIELYAADRIITPIDLLSKDAALYSGSS